MEIIAFNPGLTFFTWIVFLIVLGGGSYFGWSPIVETLERRENKIQDDVTTAEEEREKAEQLRQERKQELNEAHEEAREIVENGREKGDNERERIITEARDEADSMVDQAENEIERKEKQAFDTVKGEVGEMALDLTQKLLREEIDEDDHQRIVQEFLDDIQEEQPVG